MSRNSNVGNSQIYNDNDQRATSGPQNDQKHRNSRFHQGKVNSHKANDTKDQRSIANRLANEENKKNDTQDEGDEIQMLKKDPTLPAKIHGNKPSKGAEIDAQILADEHEELKRKGKT